MPDSQENSGAREPAYVVKETEIKSPLKKSQEAITDDFKYVTNLVLRKGVLEVYIFLINSLSLLLIYSISVATEVILLRLIFSSLDTDLIKSHPVTQEVYFWLQIGIAACGLITYLIHLVISSFSLTKLEIKAARHG